MAETSRRGFFGVLGAAAVGVGAAAVVTEAAADPSAALVRLTVLCPRCLCELPIPDYPTPAYVSAGEPVAARCFCGWRGPVRFFERQHG